MPDRIAVTHSGDREIALRLEKFPAELHDKIAKAISELTEELYRKILATEPFKTGKLKSETVEREFSDKPDRIAGYVSIYAPGDPNEYAKAATLEYGTDKPRKTADRTRGVFARLTGSSRRINAKLSKPVHIAARMYLRGPLADMRSLVEERLQAALAEAVHE